MTDIELLPLLEGIRGMPLVPDSIIQDYARANVAHHTAKLQAENEALRAEVNTAKGQAEFYRTERNKNQRKAERLAEAINAYKSECDNPAKDYVLRAKRRDEMFALLRDHDQERNDG